METLSFEIVTTKEITKPDAEAFIKLLLEQGKVQPPTIQRIQSCEKIVFCKWGEKRVGIGAIKPKTSSDFDSSKANLQTLKSDITWELGYIYVQPEYRGLGLSSTIVRLLLRDLDKENLIASTELYSGNPMAKVLIKNGFHLMGKPWKSSRHDGYLGLFIKFKKGELKND